MKTHLIGHYATAGQSSRDVADMSMHSMPCFWMDRAAGGPLDAPPAIPAGSCNSTDVRTGPWHLNDGAGRSAPAVSYCRREK